MTQPYIACFWQNLMCVDTLWVHGNGLVLVLKTVNKPHGHHFEFRFEGM